MSADFILIEVVALGADRAYAVRIKSFAVGIGKQRIVGDRACMISQGEPHITSNAGSGIIIESLAERIYLLADLIGVEVIAFGTYQTGAIGKGLAERVHTTGVVNNAPSIGQFVSGVAAQTISVILVESLAESVGKGTGPVAIEIVPVGTLHAD